MFKNLSLFSFILFLFFYPVHASNFGEPFSSDFGENSPFKINRRDRSLSEKPKSKPILDFSIKKLKDVLKIARFDPRILSEEDSVGEPLKFEGMDSSFSSQLVLFYSESEEEREDAFFREIQEPILSALGKAAEFSYDFPQTLKYLGDANNWSKSLVKIAIKDIFSNELQSIEELLKIVENLNENRILTKEEKEGLKTFKKLSGYFYDQKALKYLEEELVGEQGFFEVHKKPTLRFNDPLVKFSLLRILQRIGEFSKSISSSTLTLMLDESAKKLLYELRDRHLSHITSRKLELVLSAGEDLFKKVYDDLQALAHLFKRTSSEIPTEESFSTPLEHWKALKNSEAVGDEILPPVERRGLEGLRNLLSYSKKSVEILPISIDREVNALLPFPYTEEEIDRIEGLVKKSDTISKILRNEELSSVEDLHEKLQAELGEDIDIRICNTFFTSYTALTGEERDLFKDLEAEKKVNKIRIQEYLVGIPAAHRKIIFRALSKPRVEKFIQKARNIIRDQSISDSGFEEVLENAAKYEEKAQEKREENRLRKIQISEEKKRTLHLLRNNILEVEAEELEASMEEYSQVKNIKKKRATLKGKLEDRNIVKPSYGYRNFSDEFESFCAFLKSQEVEVDETYNWLESYMSSVKKLFHKAHYIPIETIHDQCRHRYSRVQELIKFIHLIRQVATIEEDIALEVEKESFRQFIDGKSTIMTDCIRRVEELRKGEDVRKQLSEIQAQFYSLRDKMKVSLKESELVKSQEVSRKLIKDFLKMILDQGLLSDPEYDTFKKKLEDLARTEKRRQLLHFLKKEIVKASPRGNEHQKLSEKIEESVKISPIRRVGYEFLVGAFYELFKEVNDYKEFSVLRPFDQVRNYFFHPDPFHSESLIVKNEDGSDSETNIKDGDNIFGTISKEVSLLTVNVKFLLEQFLFDMVKVDSLPKKPLESQVENFDVEVQDKTFRLKEVEIPGNGDCGYLAMGTTRLEAVELLNRNSSTTQVRKLVGQEIYDMFATLPEKIIQTENYKNIYAEQVRLDHEFQSLITSMNDNLSRPEGDRWDEDRIFEHCSDVELNETQRNYFEELRTQRQSMEREKLAFCEREDTYQTYVNFYMRPEVTSYIRKYGESNWLNSSSVSGRKSSADALAELMEKNLVIVNQEGTTEHEYINQEEITAHNTLFLLHVGNWHFNRLEINE